MSHFPPAPYRKTLPLFALVFLAMAWSTYWYMLSTSIKSRYAELEQRLASTGTVFTCADVAWGGFPFRIAFTCTRPRLDLAGDRQLTRAESGALTVSMQAYDFRHFVAELDGPTDLAGAALGPLAVTHGRLTASLTVADGQPARLAVAVPGLAAGGIVTASDSRLDATLDPNGRLTAQTSLTGLRLNGPRPLAADRIAAGIDVPPAIALSPDPIRTAAATGAAVTLHHVEFQRGGLLVSAAGQVGLTPDLRLTGEATTKFSDVNRLLTAVQEVAQLNDADLGTMATLLRVLTAGKNEITVPLRADKGVIYWGPFRIVEISAITQ
jgi:hypothetical protein